MCGQADLGHAPPRPDQSPPRGDPVPAVLFDPPVGVAKIAVVRHPITRHLLDFAQPGKRPRSLRDHSRSPSRRISRRGCRSIAVTGFHAKHESLKPPRRLYGNSMDYLRHRDDVWINMGMTCAPIVQSLVCYAQDSSATEPNRLVLLEPARNHNDGTRKFRTSTRWSAAQASASPLSQKVRGCQRSSVQAGHRPIRPGERLSQGSWPLVKRVTL